MFVYLQPLFVTHFLILEGLILTRLIRSLELPYISFFCTSF